MNSLLLGCIADDFTGATDLASNLVRHGMRVIQTIGLPTEPLPENVDAVVIALKSRTIPSKDAVSQTLEALAWLKKQSVQQVYFKYCSTFDSTPDGNIGPVTDALMEALGTTFTIATPAFPENGRTVFKGHLFVGDVLLSESGMKDHPLTPMRDSHLVRVLQAQTKQRVGLIEYATVLQGSDAIVRRMQALKEEGVGIAVVDALRNDDLMTLGPALANMPLVTAGSGVAIGLPQNFGLVTSDKAASLPAAKGRKAIVSGSCSLATNGQVTDFLRRGGAGFAIDPMDIAQGKCVAADALAWAEKQDAGSPVLIYATARPEAVQQVQERLGTVQAGALVEDALSDIARGLVQQGVGQLIVAGGETSGACVQALEIRTLRIGTAIAPGVPWCHAATAFSPTGSIHITLKSGNFGAEDFFSAAFDRLD